MISDLLRQVGAGLAEFLEREAGHVIVLMILIWWGISSWPCTSISASAWRPGHRRAVLRAEREEAMTPDQVGPGQGATWK